MKADIEVSDRKEGSFPCLLKKNIGRQGGSNAGGRGESNLCVRLFRRFSDLSTTVPPAMHVSEPTCDLFATLLLQPAILLEIQAGIIILLRIE